jgi:hypothetical protein
VPAVGGQAVLAVVTRSVGDHHARQDPISGPEVRDLGADVLDDTDELVSDPPAGLLDGDSAVEPQIAPADGGMRDANDGVGGIDDRRIVDVSTRSCARDGRRPA